MLTVGKRGHSAERSGMVSCAPHMQGGQGLKHQSPFLGEAGTELAALELSPCLLFSCLTWVLSPILMSP